MTLNDAENMIVCSFHCKCVLSSIVSHQKQSEIRVKLEQNEIEVIKSLMVKCESLKNIFSRIRFRMNVFVGHSSSDDRILNCWRIANLYCAVLPHIRQKYLKMKSACKMRVPSILCYFYCCEVCCTVLTISNDPKTWISAITISSFSNLFYWLQGTKILFLVLTITLSNPPLLINFYPCSNQSIKLKLWNQ